MPMDNKTMLERFSQCPKQRRPGDRTWENEDVPTNENDPKSEQDPLPPKKGKNKEREP